MTSALNFDTPDCRVTGGCDLYTTKAAGPDKKLYKSIDRSLESQHAAMVRFGASLSPPQREELAASLNLSRSSPFGPLSEIASRRTFAYLIATLNASHPDYDFSHTLRPQDFRRERSLRRAMADIDSTLQSVRPGPPPAAVASAISGLVDASLLRDGGGGVASGVGVGAMSSVGGGANGSGHSTGNGPGRRKKDASNQGKQPALSKQSSSASTTSGRRSATPAVAAKENGSNKHGKATAPGGDGTSTTRQNHKSPTPTAAVTSTSADGGSSTADAATTGGMAPSAPLVPPIWGPHMWALINREMTLAECLVFRYCPVEDPFADDEPAAVWSLHYFFFNKTRKRVAYLYARAVPVLSSGSPPRHHHVHRHHHHHIHAHHMHPPLTLLSAADRQRRRRNSGLSASAAGRSLSPPPPPPAGSRPVPTASKEPSTLSTALAREESAASYSSTGSAAAAAAATTKRARATSSALLARHDDGGAGGSSDDAGAHKRARFWLGDRYASAAVRTCPSSDEEDEDDMVEEGGLVWNRGDADFGLAAGAAGYCDDDDAPGIGGGIGFPRACRKVTVDLLSDDNEEEEDEDEDEDVDGDDDDDFDETDRRATTRSPVRGMSEDIVARMEMDV